MKKYIPLLLIVVSLAGCASLKDFPKLVIGTSTRDLEAARANSIYQDYPHDKTTCFDAVLRVVNKNKYYVFMQDPSRGIIVVMNIPDFVDTTEVGVFITELPQGQGARVEFSSRSSPAKKAVAKLLFGELSDFFNKRAEVK